MLSYLPATAMLFFSRGVLWALVACFILALGATAGADSPVGDVTGKTFKAAIVRDFPPLYLMDAADNPTGFAIDLLAAVAREGGFSVEYVVTENWAAAAELVRSGQADFVPGFGINDYRLAEFDFSVPMESIPVRAFVKINDKRIGRIEDLADARFATAVIDEGAADVELRRRGGYNLVTKDNVDQGLNALLAGHVDAFVFPEPVLRQKLRAMGLEDHVGVVGEPLLELKRGYLFAKEDPHLADFNRLLNQQVNSPFYAELLNRWYGAPSPFWTMQKSLPAILAVLVLVSLLFVLWKNHSVRQSNRRLAESKELLARSQEIAHIGSWQLDVVANHLTWSNEVYRIFGCEPQGFAATYEAFLSFIHPVDRDYVNAAYNDSLRDESNKYEVEHRIIRAGTGQIRHVRQKCVHERDAAGKVLRSIGMIQDITGRKQSELALRESKRCLAAQNQELEQIVYVASHDLRSPLVNIDGFSRELEYSLRDIGELLDKDEQDHTQLVHSLRTEFPDMQQSLARIRTSAHQMDILLKGLLKISRLGRDALEISIINMNDLMRELSGNFAFLVQEQDIELIVEDLPPCQGDIMQLTQVFSNLLENAIKYLDKGRPGKVRVSGKFEDGRAVYRVEDNGVGINVNHLDNIFELFHRLDPGDSDGEGLGLTIVRQILSRLDGEITVESTPGSGSTFIVGMPSGV